MKIDLGRELFLLGKKVFFCTSSEGVGVKEVTVRTGIRIFYIFFYSSILGVVMLAGFGLIEGLHAEGKVIEKFEAGPIKVPKKQVFRAKTHFEWNLENPCPCNDDEAPCIKSFLDKDLPTTTPEYAKSYKNFSNKNTQYQGGSVVPNSTGESSVRVIVIPFCRQDRKS